MLILFDGEFGARQTQRFTEEVLRVGHWSWDLSSGIMHWSRGVYELLGADPDSLNASSANFENFLHPEDRLEFSRTERLLRHSIAVEREFRIINSSGRIRWIMFKAEPIAGDVGDPNRAAGICHDITGHREDLLLLQQNAQRSHTIAKLSGALCWVAKPDGSFIEFFNIPHGPSHPEFSVGTSWSRLVHPDDRGSFDEAWRNGIAAHAEFAVEHRMLASEGPFPCWTLAAPIFDHARNIVEWLGVSKDLTGKWDRPQAKTGILTGSQIRAARAILNWSVDRLAVESGIRPGTIRRLEEIDSVSSSDGNEMSRLEATLVNAGIDFVFSSQLKPGVRPR